MPETFTWCPMANTTGQATFRIRKAQFGDGYAQRVVDGINNKVMSWPLTFRGKSAYIADIKAFLDRQQGATPFYFTPPGDVQGLYICESYNVQPMGGDMYTLSATFLQDFTP